jgi:hypothetical protein
MERAVWVSSVGGEGESEVGALSGLRYTERGMRAVREGDVGVLSGLRYTAPRTLLSLLAA